MAPSMVSAMLTEIESELELEMTAEMLWESELMGHCCFEDIHVVCLSDCLSCLLLFD
jgi:hypothetical protein